MTDPVQSKYDVPLWVFVLPFVLLFSGCAAVKAPDVSGLYCTIVSCPGFEAYQKALKLDGQGETEGALAAIDAALKKDAANPKYAALKKALSLKQQCIQFDTAWRAYDKIDKNDLDGRTAALDRLKALTGGFAVSDQTNEAARQVQEEIGKVAAEKAEVGALPKKMAEAIAVSDCDGLLTLLEKVKPYRVYLSAHAQAAPSVGDCRKPLEVCIEKAYGRHDEQGVLWILGRMDEIAGDNRLTKDRRARYAARSKKRAGEFLRKGKVASAMFFLALADCYRRDEADQEVFGEAAERMKDYKEKLYVAVRGDAGGRKAKEAYEDAVHTGLEKSFQGYFGRARSQSEATVSVLISIERRENNIAVSRPQVKYSKFVSGYNRVPNEAYYRTQRQLAEARAEVRRLGSERVDGWGGAIANGLAQGLWRSQVIEYERRLASDEVYDMIPILVDYKYRQTDVAISNLVRISYTIIDAKRKKVLKEDAVTEKTSETLAVLEEVHPEDYTGLVNSEAFDPAVKKGEFSGYVDTVFEQAADKIAADSAALFEEREKDYLALGEWSEAVDSHLTGDILKHGELSDPVFDSLPKEAVARLGDLTPQSGLARKLAKRSPPVVAMQSSVRPKASAAVAAVPAAKAAGEAELPAIVAESRDKVVLVKHIDKSGIVQGSGFLVSSRGHVVTARHLVANASAVLVETADGGEHVGKVLKSDRVSDLALVKIDLEDAPFFRLCDANALSPGQTVIAIGAPSGEEQVASQGVIGAVTHLSPARTKTKLLVIRTDADMAEGSGGGPLINLAGQVVGVNAPALQAGGGTDGAPRCAVSTDEIRRRLQSVFP